MPLFARKPGSPYYGEFTTSRFDTGQNTDADTLPTAVANHNGTDDASFVLTVARLDQGNYSISGTVPTGYAAGDTVTIRAIATVNGVTGKGVTDRFTIDTKLVSDLQDVSNAQIIADIQALRPSVGGGGSGGPAGTLPFTYTSQVEIERIYSPRAAAARASWNKSGQVDAAIYNDAVNDATDHVNLYCQNHYDPQAMSTNAWIRKQASWLGCFFLSQLRGNPAQYEARYEKITGILEKIQQGIFQVPRLATTIDLTPAMSNYVIDDYFNIDKIRVQPSISTGGSYGQQFFDPVNPNDWY